MTLWQRIWQWLACQDPEDVDSSYPNTTGTFGPVTPADEYAPGEDTWKKHKAAYRPSTWDKLNERRGKGD